MTRLAQMIGAALPVVLAGTAAATATPARADALVVRSNGPNATTTYPVGRRLTATERVVLRAGERVVLVGEGGTRTLSGPGSFPVRSANIARQGNRATLGRFMSTGGGTISRTGAVRGPGDDTPRAPNLWVVDINRGGTFCITDPAALTLWRADMSVDTLLTVENVATPTQRASLAFVAGQNFRAWPTDRMPVADGSSYRISGPGVATTTEVRFISIGAPPAEAEAVAGILADRGCLGQLEQLGDRMAEAAAGR